MLYFAVVFPLGTKFLNKILKPLLDILHQHSAKKPEIWIIMQNNNVK